MHHLGTKTCDKFKQTCQLLINLWLQWKTSKVKEFLGCKKKCGQCKAGRMCVILHRVRLISQYQIIVREYAWRAKACSAISGRWRQKGAVTLSSHIGSSGGRLIFLTFVLMPEFNSSLEARSVYPDYYLLYCVTLVAGGEILENTPLLYSTCYLYHQKINSFILAQNSPAPYNLFPKKHNKCFCCIFSFLSSSFI